MSDEPAADETLRREIDGAHAQRRVLLALPRLTPAEAWQVFADTDGLNRALGNPDVVLVRGPEGGARRRITTATTPAVGYEEEDYQWEAGRWVGGRRFFDDGPPLARFEFLFAVRAADEGTIADVRVGMWGRGDDGAAAAEAAADSLGRGFAALADEMAALVDEPMLAGKLRGSHRVDPAQLLVLQRALVDSGEDADVVARLARHVDRMPDGALLHMQPRALARAWGVDETRTTNAFLRATRLGLLRHEWGVACPSCRGVKGGTTDASALAAAPVHCADCGIRFDADPTANLVLAFAPDAKLRALRETWACVGAPTRTPHVVALAYVDAGARLRLAHDAPRGFVLRCPVLDVSVAIDGPGAYAIEAGGIRRVGDADGVVVVNATDGRVRARLEDPRPPDTWLRAVDVLASDRFRALFRADEWDFLSTMTGAWRASFGVRAVRVEPPPRYDVVVVGAGPGGEACALRAAQHGRSVAVVEAGATFGGPSGLVSKALREATRKVAAWIDAECGSASSRRRLDAVFERRFRLLKGYVTTLEMQDVLSRMARAGVHLHHGRASLAADGAVVVRRDGDDEPLVLRADDVVLATGSRAVRPDGIPFDDRTVLDADQLGLIEQVPQSLCLVGGGVVGCEIATILAALGVQVTIVARRAFLEGMDEDLRASLDAHMEGAGITVVRGEARAVRGGDAPVVVVDDGRVVAADVVLVAAGRRPATATLDLAAAGVEVDARGRVVVDASLRTSRPHVYAVGDVIGPPELASAAARQGQDAADAIRGAPPPARAPLVPTTLWTLPEIASVGATEQQARARGDVVVGRARFRDTPRGILAGDTCGWLKLVAADDGRVVGVHVFGEGGCELVHYGRLLVDAGTQLVDVAGAGFSAMTQHGAFAAAAEDALASQRRAGGVAGATTAV